jgi:hypothetical protein
MVTNQNSIIKGILMRLLGTIVCTLLMAGALSGVMFAQVPSAPTHLVVSTIMGGAMLEWDTSAHALGYRVYRSIDTIAFGGIGIVERHSFVDFFVYPRFTYRYYVTALNLAGESTPSDTVEFMVGPPPPPPGFGVIKGMVADDSSGAPVNGTIVQFFKPFRAWRMRFERTDSAGNYFARLDSGKYLVRAEAPGYFPKWYNNVNVPDSGSLVTIGSHDTVTANFALHAFRPPAFAHVSGSVIDTSGTPLKGAWVAYMRTHRELLELEHLLHIFGGLPAERLFIPDLGHLPGVVWAGRTDSSGNYAGAVIEGLRYVALAYKPGYALRFFDGKRSPFDADRIYVTGDTSGINFALPLRSVSSDSIAGTVVDSTGAGIASHVILIRLTVNGLLITHYRATDSLGNFIFHHVDPGKFLLRAIPVDGYHPAWYSASQCGVENYHHADTLTLSGSMTGLQVCVSPNSDSGFTTIAGMLHGPQSYFSTRAATSIPGVAVYAVSSTSGQIVAYDIVESDGSFAIENLPPDTYTLVGDKEGYTSAASASFSVDETNFALTNASLSLTPDAPLAVHDPPQAVPGVYRLEQNYPNPFNPTTTIGYTLPENSHVMLEVYNVLGQRVMTLKNGVENAGYKTVQLDASAAEGGLPSGIYFYRLEATSTAKPNNTFTMVRKLVLLK